MNGDCFECMSQIPDKSVDFVLCDPPYGTMKGANIGNFNSAEWDVTLDTDKLFTELRRVCRHNAKVVLFCQEPYTTELINHSDSYMQFCQKAVWLKNNAGNSLSCRASLVQLVEDILIFRVHNLIVKDFISRIDEVRTRIETIGVNRVAHIMMTDGRYNSFATAKKSLYKKISVTQLSYGSFFDERLYTIIDREIGMPYPWEEYERRVQEIKSSTESVFNLPEGVKSKTNVFKFPKDRTHFHPTQKPVALLEDIIKTYSHEGDLVLDFTMGSGSTIVACANTGRRGIGIERNRDFYSIAEKRVRDASASMQGVLNFEFS